MSRSNSWDTNSRGAVQRLATIVSNAVEITRIFERFCYHSCPSLCLNSQTIVTSRAVAVTLTLLTFSLFTTFGFTFCLLIKPTIILYSGGEPQMSCKRTRDCCWDRFTPRGRVSCPGKKKQQLQQRYKGLSVPFIFVSFSLAIKKSFAESDHGLRLDVRNLCSLIQFRACCSCGKDSCFFSINPQ